MEEELPYESGLIAKGSGLIAKGSGLIAKSPQPVKVMLDKVTLMEERNRR